MRPVLFSKLLNNTICFPAVDSTSILEKVKATKTSRSRSRSVSSITSIASKRALSGDKVGGKSPIRPKLGTKLPVKA